MANVKLSAITASGSNLIGADTLVGVHSGTTDLLFSGTQIAAFVNASPTITGHATVEGVTATGATGTGKLVFDGTPTLVTPVLGVATGTSIALGGATIGSNALAITGTAAISSTANIIGALTLGTQGTTQGSLILGNTNSTFSTTIKSSNTTSAAWVMTLPTTAGTNTYVLSTDGSGVCSWAAPSAGSTSYTFTLSGNVSAAAWTTTGIGLVGAAASFTDTSSSGTVAAMYINRLGIGTVLASSATTYSDSYGLWVEPPAASTNVTMTRKWAAAFNGIVGIATSLNIGAVNSQPSGGTSISCTGNIIFGNGVGTIAVSTGFQLYTADTNGIYLQAGSAIGLRATHNTGSILLGVTAPATTATDGFPYIPGGAGTPTGVPTSNAGFYPLYWDHTNKKLYIYDGAWLGGTSPGIWV
jgi:hypothetical protein